MEWVLRLVETGIDGQSRSSDVMAFSRPDGLSLARKPVRFM
jgi:hypothetical protein